MLVPSLRKPRTPATSHNFSARVKNAHGVHAFQLSADNGTSAEVEAVRLKQVDNLTETLVLRLLTKGRHGLACWDDLS